MPITVDIEWVDGQLKQAVIRSSASACCNVLARPGYTLTANGKNIPSKDGFFELRLSAKTGGTIAGCGKRTYKSISMNNRDLGVFERLFGASRVFELRVSLLRWSVSAKKMPSAGSPHAAMVQFKIL
jgi:hypothetical protein